MLRADFVHLNVHSHYTLLDATCRIEDLVQTASGLGYHALALTDSGNLFGAVEFYKKAREKGIKPILGAELFVTDGPRDLREKTNAVHNIGVLVQDLVGYKNLVKLVSIGYLEGFHYRPRIDESCLAGGMTRGLIALSGNTFGKVNRLLLRGKYDEAVAVVRHYQDLFEGRFHLEIQNHGRDEERLLAPQLARLAKETGAGLLATNEVRYTRQEDAVAREVLKCIATGKSKDLASLRPETDQHYLKSPAQMRDLFGEFPVALDNTLTVADQCNLELDFSSFHLPRFEVPPGMQDSDHLEQLCRDAIPSRYEEWTDEAEKRLTFELGVITKMGFSSYFLIVWDFIRHARSEGIPVGPGRGSAAGSMVAYLLAITNLDPLRYGLFFERFLNPGRISMPDIDIDFCERRRGEVIAYVRDKYGKDNVCHIITFGVLKPKAALKDASRVLGLPFNEANRITQAVPPDLNITLEESLTASAELRRFADQYPDLFQIAASLEGCVRHSSTHAAGVVITPVPLWDLVPIYQRDGETATQYTMKWLETAGILKMDFLGLSTLTIIQLAIDNIRQNRGQVLDIDRIPLNDKRTFKLLASGATSGVFTFETSSFKDLLKRLRPTAFEDLVAAQALGRPGPLQSGMVDEYIAAKHGQKEVRYPHPSLQGLLEETNGVFIYQEQVMQTANLMAGYSLAEADGLRKAMGKKIPAEMEKHRERFQRGAVSGGIQPGVAEEIFNTMEKFAAYGFNKAHSACYALVSYQTAYLKANFAPEFMAALLTVNMGDTDKIAQMIEECQRLKIEVLPPDVDESRIGFSVHQKKIRFGLGAVRNLGANVARAILDARRQHGRFRSLEDFCQAVDTKTVNRRSIESLIKCGAFDGFPHNRAQMLAVVDQALQLGQDTQRHQIAGQGTLLDFFSRQNIEVEQSLLTYPEIPNFSDREVLNFEKETLGLYLSGHPLLQHQPLLDRMNMIGVPELEELDEGASFMLPGIIKTVRKVRVKSTGKYMAIVTLEDLRSSLEIPIFGEVLEKFGDQVIVDHLVVLYGKMMKRRDGDKRPVVDGLAPLENLMTNRAWKTKVFLECAEEDVTRELTAQVRNILLGNSGRHPVFWRVRTAGAVVTIRLDKSYKVTPNRGLVKGLEDLLGERSVKLQIEMPPTGKDAPKPGAGGTDPDEDESLPDTDLPREVSSAS